MLRPEIDRAAVIPATRARCRLPRAALAMAVAAAFLPATSAWADICGAGTTTISSNTAPAAGDNCLLQPPSESLVVQTGKSLTTTFNSVVSVTGGTVNGSIDNGGSLNADAHDPAVDVFGGTLTGGINNRSGAMIDGAEGIWIECNAVIQNGILNAGTIVANGTGGDNHGIALSCLSAQITGGITNTGQITTTRAGYFSVGNSSGGSIDFIANLQGGVTPLTYGGKLPGEYRIIVNSPASYGILAGTNVSSTMTFTVNPGSTLQVGVYPGVLTGVAAANLTGALNGTFGQFAWQLVQTAPTSNQWNLVVTPNVPAAPPTPVPAMPVLGGALLAGLLGLFGARYLRRRRAS